MLDFLKNLKNSSPIVTPNAQRQQSNLDALQTVMDYQNMIKSDTQNMGLSPHSLELVNKIGAENIANGVGKGLNNGVPEIADWINQYNNGSGRVNPLVDQQQTPQPGVPLQGGIIEKPTAMNNIMSALKDLQSGYRENVSTPFAVENLEANPNKSVMNRVGEGLGSAVRIADNPLTKAAIVGGLVSATGGSPAQALGYGIKTGNIAQQSQMRNNLYRTKLKDMGYSEEDLARINGYLGNDEFKTVSDGIYKEGMIDYRNGMLQNSIDKAQTDAMYKNGTLDIRKGMLDVARQNAGTNSRRANIYQQIANKGGSNGKPLGAKGSGAKNPMYGKHLAEYNAILQSGDDAKIKYAQSKFIETYGEDPARALKSENDILKLLDALQDE